MSTPQEHAHRKGSAKPPDVSNPEAPPAAPTRRVGLVSKLSTQTVWGKVERPAPDAGPVALFNIYGVTHSIKRGATSMGEYTAFLGNFEAVNLKTGEVFAAGKAFLPRVVEEMVVGALTAAQGADMSASVQFALQVGIKPDAKNAYGYVYTCTPLVPIAQGDVLEHLRAVGTANAPALTHQT
jgi:hypothetical protein